MREDCDSWTVVGALRFGTLAQPISILPEGDRKFSIFHSQFSIQPQDFGLNCYPAASLPGGGRKLLLAFCRAMCYSRGRN